MKTISTPLSRLHPVMLVVFCVLSLFLPVKAKDRTDRSPMLRIVCVTALAGHDEYVLASRDNKGKLREQGKVGLRSSLITDWLPVSAEKLELCVEDGKELVSKCSFTYPKGTRRALLILLPEAGEDRYTAHVFDPVGQKFGTGNILVLNSSTMSSEVTLGDNKVESKAGEALVTKPSLDENGMFRTLVTYKDEEGNDVTCKDVFTPGNKTGRDILVLSSDPQMGLRVVNLSESGPFE